MNGDEPRLCPTHTNPLLVYQFCLILQQHNSSTALLVFVCFAFLGYFNMFSENSQPHQSYCSSFFARHTFKGSKVHFSIPNRRQSFFLVSTHTGWPFISTFVSPYNFYRRAPPLNAMAKIIASWGWFWLST